jgi:hypothetical protein
MLCGMQTTVYQPSALGQRADRDAAIRRHVTALRDALDTNLRSVDNEQLAFVSYLDCEQVTSILTAILNDDSYEGHDAEVDRKGVRRRCAAVCDHGPSAKVSLLDFEFSHTRAPKAMAEPAAAPTPQRDVAVKIDTRHAGIEYLGFVDGEIDWTNEISQAKRFGSDSDAHAFVHEQFDDTLVKYVLEEMLPAELYALRDDADWIYAFEMVKDKAIIVSHECDGAAFDVFDVAEVIAAKKTMVDPDDCSCAEGVFRLSDGRFAHIVARLGNDNGMEGPHDGASVNVASSMDKLIGCDTLAYLLAPTEGAS